MWFIKKSRILEEHKVLSVSRIWLISLQSANNLFSNKWLLPVSQNDLNSKVMYSGFLLARTSLALDFLSVSFSNCLSDLSILLFLKGYLIYVLLE